jgi:peroxiredoxin
MRLIALFLLAFGAVACSVRADQKAPTAKLGKQVADFTFQQPDGRTLSLHDLKEKKAIVIVFLSFDCPVSTSYSPLLAEMAREFGKQGVSFIGLTTNEGETPAQVARQAGEYALPFPVVPDIGHKAADGLKAEITPEAFVLDRHFVLRYRGRIDDGFQDRLKKNPRPKQDSLRQALADVLAGRPVREPATVAVGCPIVRPGKAVATGNVTYYRDVLPILQNRCQTCHRPGEVGPFSLMTYRQAKNWGEDIKSYTQKHIMPPWKPVDSPPFHNDRSMPDREIATLAAWVDGGMPEGNSSDGPPPKVFPKGWQLGTPDLVLTLPEDFTVAAEGRDLFRCFVLPTNLPEDKYVAAVEVRPGNPRVVHHILLYVDAAHQGRLLEERQRKLDAGKKTSTEDNRGDRGPGYTVAMGIGFAPRGGLSGWAPGHMPRYLPQGSGYLLPRGSDVVMQVHFHRNGRVEKEKTMVGLYFSKTKENRRYVSSVMAGTDNPWAPLPLFFAIPPGAERYKLKGDMWATGDYNLHSIMPHMHLLGREIKVTMTPPGGMPRTLIHIKDWDYNWQETYFFKTPIAVKAGTNFHVEAYYDNSDKNPHNPFHPPRRVTYGEETTNEMCFVFLGGLTEQPSRRLPMSPRRPKQDARKQAAR